MPMLVPFLPLMTALAALGGTIASAVGGRGGGGDQAKALRDSQMAALRSSVGRTTPDILAQTSGGASPQFIANLAAENVGQPGQGIEALKGLQEQFPGLGGG